MRKLAENYSTEQLIAKIVKMSGEILDCREELELRGWTVDRWGRIIEDAVQKQVRKEKA